MSCTRALEGRRIAIDRLDGTLTDVPVRIESANGGVRTARLTLSDPSFVVPEAPGPLMVLRAYVDLGVSTSCSVSITVRHPGQEDLARLGKRQLAVPMR